MKTVKQIVDILHSIKDVRLSADEKIEVKFGPPSATFSYEWEPNAGFKDNSFTEQLLLLIEAELKGELTE